MNFKKYWETIKFLYPDVYNNTYILNTYEITQNADCSSFMNYVASGPHTDIHLTKEQWETNIQPNLKALQWFKTEKHTNIQLFSTTEETLKKSYYVTYYFKVLFKGIHVNKFFYINVIIDSPFLDCDHTTPIAKLITRCKE